MIAVKCASVSTNGCKQKEELDKLNSWSHGFLILKQEHVIEANLRPPAVVMCSGILWFTRTLSDKTLRATLVKTDQGILALYHLPALKQFSSRDVLLEVS